MRSCVKAGMQYSLSACQATVKAPSTPVYLLMAAVDSLRLKGEAIAKENSK